MDLLEDPFDRTNDSTRRIVTVSDDALDAVERELARLGVIYDTEYQFPVESVRLLRRAGLLTLFGPIPKHGRSSDALTEVNALSRVLRRVGRGDLSVGRLYEGHVNAIQLIKAFGSLEQVQTLSENLSAGKTYGVWATERGAGVKLAAKADRLSGQKAFASGAGHIDYAVITAQPPEGDAQLVIIRANEALRADASHWRVRGMRATLSGTYNVDDLPVAAGDLLGKPGMYTTEPAFSAGAWRFTAVQLGGIEALLKEVRAAIPEASKADALQRLKFIDAVVATRTAFLWVREAANRAARCDVHAPAFAGLTRSVVEMAGLQVMDLAARMVGTRSAFDGERIDKISRDLSLYLRQASPDQVKDRAAVAWLEHDAWSDGDELW